MTRENKLVLADFLNGEKFDLSCYLNYLLTEYNLIGQNECREIVIH